MSSRWRRVGGLLPRCKHGVWRRGCRYGRVAMKAWLWRLQRSQSEKLVYASCIMVKCSLESMVFTIAQQPTLPWSDSFCQDFSTTSIPHLVPSQSDQRGLTTLTWILIMEVKHPRRILAVGAPGSPVLDVVKGMQSLKPSIQLKLTSNKISRAAHHP